MSTTLFAGCSMTAGTGFSLEKDEPGLWVNLLHKNNNVLSTTKLLNVAMAGRSNAGIFQDAVYNILHNDNINYAFVAWTNVIRYEVLVGLECYTTRAVLMPNIIQKGYNLNTVNYPASYIQNINDRLTLLVHPHYEIVNLLNYINILTMLCKLKNCQLFFINATCDWDNDYFTKKYNVMPEDYTNYTKELLSIATRSDEEIHTLYEKMHNEYRATGGIQENNWLNLYQSFYSTIIDNNDDNIHPGLQSNHKYYTQLSTALESKLIMAN
jgi:hypothetical protein